MYIVNMYSPFHNKGGVSEEIILTNIINQPNQITMNKIKLFPT